MDFTRFAVNVEVFDKKIIEHVYFRSLGAFRKVLTCVTTFCHAILERLRVSITRIFPAAK